MKYLVDTNVISDARRPLAASAVRDTLARINDADLFLSAITIGEIARGISKLDPGRRRQELEAWLVQTEVQFSDRLLPIDRAIARLWGELTAQVAKKGHTIHVADGLVAATALHHGLCLLTRNVKDFAAVGIPVADPWHERIL